MCADGVLGLKIDVDTYQGMKNGVPRLLSVMAELSVKGTFYLSMGPDASGLAVLQLLKNPRFLKKMIHSNAPGLYGFRTALYGTLLPSPMIALSFPDIVRKIIADGHEVQLHAWDHRRWQDGLYGRSESWIRDWLEKGIAAFEQLTDRRPTSFGAPAWLIDDRVLHVLKEYSWEYLSCTRAPAPFLHEGLNIPEIPSDLPCFEEVGVSAGLALIMKKISDRGLHILPVHAEAEGGIWRDVFFNLIKNMSNQGYQFKTLGEIRNDLIADLLPCRKYQMALLSGRSVPCCV